MNIPTLQFVGLVEPTEQDVPMGHSTQSFLLVIVRLRASIVALVDCHTSARSDLM